MNPEGLDHEPLFVALAWFNGMTATPPLCTRLTFRLSTYEGIVYVEIT